MKNIYGSEVDLCADDVVITAGCNMAFAAAVLAIATAGDEVILPVPWYVILPYLRVFDLLIDKE
jgi:aspartate/methionine/tyrosine aminotransferase